MWRGANGRDVYKRQATITATSHNGIEATCAVNVSARTEGIELSVVGGGKAEVSVGESDLTVRAVALGEAAPLRRTLSGA